MKAYAPRPLKVSKTFWDFMVYCHPGLLKEKFFLRLMQHITHGPRDRKAGCLVVNEGMVRAMSECYHKGTTVRNLLEWFEQEVEIKLNISNWDSEEGVARTIEPSLSPKLRWAIEEEKQKVHKRGDMTELVWYDSGKPVTEKNERKTLEDYDRSLLEIAAQMPEDHPAKRLLDYLHAQTPRQVELQLQRTSHFVWDTIMAMPGRKWIEGDAVFWDKDQERKDYALNHFRAMMQFPITRYKCVRNTLRIFSQGWGLAKLPKELRKLTLAGCWELDLAAAQLGIVAKIWHCPKLKNFLESGGDIWQELYAWLAVESQAKGKMKQALYSVIFGSSKGHKQPELQRKYPKQGIRNRWVADDLWDDGLSAALCERFLRHRLIKEVYHAAQVELDKVIKQGGDYDAFGRWWDLTKTGKPDINAAARSVLSAIVQSHELKIMLQMLPVLQSLNRCYPMVFLHDGITIRFSGRTREQEEADVAKIAVVINDYCQRNGYLTHLKPEHLPIPGETR